MRRGKFIVIEGLDGSGKTTQLKRLAVTLRKKNLSVVTTFEPTDSPIGKLIDQFLQGRKKMVPPSSLQLLFVADRVAHGKFVIEPALAAGKIVISDRYLWSTVAYGSLNLDRDWLFALNRYCLPPDLFIFLKTSPQICLARINERGEEKNFFEKEKELTAAAKTYDFLTRQFANQTLVFDGEKDKDILAQEIREKVFAYFHL